MGARAGLRRRGDTPLTGLPFHATSLLPTAVPGRAQPTPLYLFKRNRRSPVRTGREVRGVPRHPEGLG